MKNKDLPAYPQSNEWIIDLEEHIIRPDKYGSPSFIGIGLTKREYFAGLAMQGLLANDILRSDGILITTHLYAKYSVEYADALLKELDKTDEQL